MIIRHFIEDQKLIKQMLRRLKPTGDLTNNCLEIYVDPTTGEKWGKYEFELEDQINYAIGLRLLPYPDTDKLIEIALTSSHIDEIHGAAALLLDQEHSDHREFREKLLNEIETKIKDITLERFNIIFNRAELYDKSNKREILGKHLNEIRNDADHFFNMSIKADELREKITATNSA